MARKGLALRACFAAVALMGAWSLSVGTAKADTGDTSFNWATTSTGSVSCGIYVGLVPPGTWDCTLQGLTAATRSGDCKNTVLTPCTVSIRATWRGPLEWIQGNPDYGFAAGTGTGTVTYSYTNSQGAAASDTFLVEITATCSPLHGEVDFTGATGSDSSQDNVVGTVSGTYVWTAPSNNPKACFGGVGDFAGAGSAPVHFRIV